jgi:uncharacterized membrane protein YhhN
LGLASFLLGHLCYTVLFLNRSKVLTVQLC